MGPLPAIRPIQWVIAGANLSNEKSAIEGGYYSDWSDWAFYTIPDPVKHFSKTVFEGLEQNSP